MRFWQRPATRIALVVIARVVVNASVYMSFYALGAWAHDHLGLSQPWRNVVALALVAVALADVALRFRASRRRRAMYRARPGPLVAHTLNARFITVSRPGRHTQ